MQSARHRSIHLAAPSPRRNRGTAVPVMLSRRSRFVRSNGVCSPERRSRHACCRYSSEARIVDDTPIRARRQRIKLTRLRSGDVGWSIQQVPIEVSDRAQSVAAGVVNGIRIAASCSVPPGERSRRS